jgi:DNA invertase Pin-like site-specific DNA recombinase
MSARPAKSSLRCAIYTRVSTDAGLDQDFNSLDAQYEGASAYIRSQAHAGWTMLRRRYDDGGFSGGSTDRPALQQLLADVRLGRMDIIVVYKVDRLTRSLADFAKLVELFDAHGVSFVSVTQQFNTTTSMGRLTLNVLLSFAQFEREVTSERIRDKIAASKRKGLWVGGVVPLGYQAKDRKIAVVESEAKTVRHIFRRYLELGSLNLLLADLRSSGITTKVRPLATGKTIGGIPFTRGPLAHLLRNRFYIGEVTYKDDILPGEQPAILDRPLFDAVQAKLDRQRSNHTMARHASDAVLMGRIFDDAGNLMTPTHALKKGVRYRYYVSSALLQGEKAKAGHVSRVAAEQVEQLVIEATRQRVGAATPESGDEFSDKGMREAGNNLTDDRQLVQAHVQRVDIGRDVLQVQMTLGGAKSPPQRPTRNNDRTDDAGNESARRRFVVLRVPWTKRPSKAAREIILPSGTTPRANNRPIRAETRAKLVTAIAQGRRWLDEIVTGTVTSVDQIADREQCTARQVNMIISLAFLSPALVRAAVEGCLPRGVGIASMRDAPVTWSLQHKMLGLAL